MKKFLLSVLFCTVLGAAQAAPLWLRYPAVSPDGSRIAFSWQGSLWVVPAEGGEAVRLTFHPSYNYAPVWSPDGRSIAFASDRYGNFDLFIMPAQGGEAKRLTTWSGGETPYCFSADGKSVIYTTQFQDPAASALFPRSSMRELYSVPVTGGRPKQLLATPAESVCCSADGKTMLYQDNKGLENAWRKHHVSSVARDLWLYDVATGQHTKLTDNPGEDRDPRLAADGRTVYFLSERNGQSFNVYSFSLDDPATVNQVTRFKTHPVRFLSVANNGLLCFGYDGEIYTCRDGEQPRKLSVSIPAGSATELPEYLNLSSGYGSTAVSADGKQVAVVMRGDIFVASTEFGTTRQVTQTPQSETGVSFSPDGRSLLYASERDGSWNIYTARIVRDEEQGFPYATLIEEEPLFKQDGHDRWGAKYSPDGKEVAFVLDREKLMVKNLATGAVRQITDGQTQASRIGVMQYAWSPDGKWFAIRYSANGHDPYYDIGLVSASGKGEIYNLTASGYTDSDPQWVLGGDAILFCSERYGMRNHASWGSLDDVMIVFLNEEAFDRFRLSKEEYALLKEEEAAMKKAAGSSDDKKESDKKKEDKKTADEQNSEEKIDDILVELRGIEDRILRLTPSSSNLGGFTLDKEGDQLFYLASFEGGMDLWKLDVRTRSTTLVQKGTGWGQLVWNKDADQLFLLGSSRITRLKSNGTTDKSVSLRGSMKLDRAAERAAMFEHVWRQEKECFYSEQMHGVDWDRMRKDYAKFLPYIVNNYDFAEMLSEMLGELNVSHTGATYYPVSSSSSESTADLGLLFDLDYEGDGLRIDEVLEKGPFDRASSKVRAGDIVERIDGCAIERGMDYFPLLNRKSGRMVLVSMRRGEERWEEVVKPISHGQQNALLYRRWVKQRAAEVDSLSNGRLGYVHIESMGDPSFRTVYADILGKYNDREGIVIDTRFNGGGRLHEDIEVLFSGQKYLEQVIRDKVVCDMPSRRWNKPSIMLICEANYSNAHGTPWVYSHTGIGRLVGMPVPGTMTSVSWERLQDPSLVFGIPIIGYRLPDGSYLENSQLEPDLKLPNSPEKIVLGEDEQLAAAVRKLLEEIDSRDGAW